MSTSRLSPAHPSRAARGPASGSHGAYGTHRLLVICFMGLLPAAALPCRSPHRSDLEADFEPERAPLVAAAGASLLLSCRRFLAAGGRDGVLAAAAEGFAAAAWPAWPLPCWPTGAGTAASDVDCTVGFAPF